MNEKMKITRRGRPPVAIQWPDVVFTAQDVVDTMPEKVSRVTVHSKLNEAVDQGSLQIVGKMKTKNGRPRISYKKTEEQSSRLTETCQP
jgi:response regulator of citrate/malate metabolism